MQGGREGGVHGWRGFHCVTVDKGGVLTFGSTVKGDGRRVHGWRGFHCVTVDKGGLTFG